VKVFLRTKKILKPNVLSRVQNVFFRSECDNQAFKNKLRGFSPSGAGASASHAEQALQVGFFAKRSEAVLAHFWGPKRFCSLRSSVALRGLLKKQLCAKELNIFLVATSLKRSQLFGSEECSTFPRGASWPLPVCHGPCAGFSSRSMPSRAKRPVLPFHCLVRASMC
jgi:hypothetical protein